MFTIVINQFGKSDIDLFASRLISKLTRYCSFKPDPNALIVDAFTVSWTNEFNDIFPPFSILGVVLKKLKEDKGDALLIAPLWSTQSWFPKILQLLVDCPVSQHLVTLPFQKSQKHPLLQKLHLTVFKLSGNRLKIKAYQNQLSTSFCTHGEIQQRNNIGLISKDVCVFALKNMLIPCHHL